MNFIGFDIETRGAEPGYALQPWRVIEGTATITDFAYSYAGQQPTLVDRASFSNDGYYVTWNGVFDVAFLIAAGYDVKHVRWVDAMLLWKWYSNSQRMEWLPAWSLEDGAKRWLKHWPYLESFLKLKASAPEPGEDDAYWELRGKTDALVTRMTAEIIWEQLTPQQRRSALIEARCIWPTANSWVSGIKLNYTLIENLKPAVTKEMLELETQLDLVNDEPKWTPSKVLRSPVQLRSLLYEQWQLPCERWTKPTKKFPQGQMATDKTALTYLSDKDDRVLDILRWRELNTQLTKFLDSPTKTQRYLGSDVAHPSPKLFSTYTGRMTYNSKVQKKYPIGVALHQWPRNKELRKLVIV